MKKTLLYSFLFSIFFSFAQKTNEIQELLSVLQNKIEFSSDSTGYGNLPYCNIQTKINEALSYHVADLNCDGLDDLVVSGVMLEKKHPITKVFIQKDMQLSLFQKTEGLLNSVTVFDDFSILYIKNDTSYSCDSFLSVTQIKIDKELEIEDTHLFADQSTDLISSTIKNKIRVSGVLRSEPTLNDEPKIDTCSSEKLLGNQIEIIEDREVYILEAKEHWRLVLYPVEKNFLLVGWILVEG